MAMSFKLHLRSKCLLFMIMGGIAAQMAIADAPIDEKQTAKGEAIYRAKCASCHGEKGEGGTKQYAEPRLIFKQLYVSGSGPVKPLA